MKYFKSFTILFFLALSLSLASMAFAQTVFEPINSNVYDFLDRMAQKGVVQFSDIARPVSRMYIAKKLLEVKEVGSREYVVGSGKEKKESRLSDVEREDLEFYLKDFGFEVKTILRSANASGGDSQSDMKSTIPAADLHSVTTLINWDPYGRWRLFSYEDSLFQINADPILGYQTGKRDGAKYSHSWNGVALYGYVAGKIGFSLSFNDNSETGTTIDPTKNFTPVTGVSITKQIIIISNMTRLKLI